MRPAADDSFPAWFEALEQRHLAELEFAEVRRALQALSGWYVERRERLRSGGGTAALGGRGKRAAFALFYGPLHFLVVRHVVVALGADRPGLSTIADLGCGTGAASAAWALELPPPRPSIEGFDVSAWAVGEAPWTWGWFGLAGRARRLDATRARLPGRGGAILAAYLANELEPTTREATWRRLLEAHAGGTSVLVVEPISRRVAPWWDDWARQARDAGGRADAWRFEAELPRRLRLLDRAAGLDHHRLTARSLYLPGPEATVEAERT